MFLRQHHFVDHAVPLNRGVTVQMVPPCGHGFYASILGLVVVVTQTILGEVAQRDVLFNR